MNNTNLKAFQEYANGFDLTEPRLKSKLHHSIRVADITEEIGASIFNNNEIIDLCYNIGLLHDVGRFPQWTKYQSFNDFRSVDHADYSCDMLFGETKLIKVFSIPEKWYQYINMATKYHNKLKIDVTELRATVKEYNLDYVLMLTLCKIIRDADKLDNFRLWIKRTSVDNHDNLETSGYTQEILDDFKLKKSCNFKLNKTLLDRAIGLLALAYDLNFDMSKRLFKTIAKEYVYSVLSNYGALLNATDKKLLETCSEQLLNDFNVAK